MSVHVFAAVPAHMSEGQRLTSSALPQMLPSLPLGIQASNWLRVCQLAWISYPVSPRVCASLHNQGKVYKFIMPKSLSVFWE